MKLLIIEDNNDIAANIGLYFEHKGHIVDFAYNGRHGLELALQEDFDIIVLDLMLPGLDGVSLCQRLKADKPAQRVLMLTARDTLDDKLEGFEAGADDYLVKPFSLLELDARLNALMRRGGSEDPGLLKVADLELDPRGMSLRRGGQALHLKPTDFRILELLMRNSRRVVPQREIIEKIWRDDPPDGDPLRVHIHTIRQQIDKPFDKPLLHTRHGVGYRLHDPDEQPD
jgi:DNA-binding response OmpR family regulator